MNKETYKSYFRNKLNESHEDLRRKSAAADTAEYNDNIGLTPEENAILDSHPHGALTRVIARHLDLHPLEVLKTTGALTADSPQEHVDNKIEDLISKHGNKIWRAESTDLKSPYYTTPAQHRYTASPENDYDESYDTGSEKQYERFMRDFTDHIHDNVSTGVHTDFMGTAPDYYHGDDGAIEGTRE